MIAAPAGLAAVVEGGWLVLREVAPFTATEIHHAASWARRQARWAAGLMPEERQALEEIATRLDDYADGVMLPCANP